MDWLALLPVGQLASQQIAYAQLTGQRDSVNRALLAQSESLAPSLRSKKSPTHHPSLVHSAQGVFVFCFILLIK